MEGSRRAGSAVRANVVQGRVAGSRGLLSLKNDGLRSLRLRLRLRRHRELSRLISSLPPPVKVLDVGGSPFFWETVESRDRCQITMLNLPDSREHDVFLRANFRNYRMNYGDARRMPEVPDNGYDLVICNSVLEHVGDWPAITDAARELRRVGRRGWVQVPAIEFPVEVHLVLPFLHWFNRSLQRRVVQTILRISTSEARRKVDGINVLSRTEMRALFPDAEIRSERVLLLPKSHLAVW
jgi:ubiquinone/menaquinone biosynthesis C-methylase UbiE